MAKVCCVCGKGKVSGNQVSHSNKHNKRTWSANLRNVRVVEEGTPKKLKFVQDVYVQEKLRELNNFIIIN